MEIIERILKTLDEKDKMAVELCRLLNIQQSTFSSWKTRKKNPPAEYLKTIADFLGVSLDYLITGKEGVTKKYTTPTEDELLELFRLLPDAKKYEFIGEIKGFLKAIEESRKYINGEERLLG